jgi:hypothetical protein
MKPKSIWSNSPENTFELIFFEEKFVEAFPYRPEVEERFSEDQSKFWNILQAAAFQISRLRVDFMNV